MALTKRDKLFKELSDECAAAGKAMAERTARAHKRYAKQLAELNAADTVGKPKRSKPDARKRAKQ